MTGTNYQRRRAPRGKGGCFSTALMVVLLALLLVACDSSTQFKTGSGAAVHVRQTHGSTQVRWVEIMVPAEFASNGNFMRAANNAVLEISRSPYVEARLDSPNVVPTQCDPGVYYCIVATRKPMNGGVAYIAWDADGHQYGLRRIELDSAPWDQAVLENAFCHEVLHQVGLAHSSDGTPGPCQNAVATDHDLELIRQSHAHSDPVTGDAMTSAQLAEKPAFTRAITHDRGFYEALARRSK